MVGIDWTIVLVAIAVVVVLFLTFDFLFAGGGMTSAMMGGAMQCGAAAMGSPFGWALIVALILVVLAAFGILFGYRG
ncbi:MAG: hypothetical protein M1482_13775 [Chloroflexi bacterium]|nr:hypothetical protein [Chloroflexota bacterium]